MALFIKIFLLVKSARESRKKMTLLLSSQNIFSRISDALLFFEQNKSQITKKFPVLLQYHFLFFFKQAQLRIILLGLGFLI